MAFSRDSQVWNQIYFIFSCAENRHNQHWKLNWKLQLNSLSIFMSKSIPFSRKFIGFFMMKSMGCTLSPTWEDDDLWLSLLDIFDQTSDVDWMIWHSDLNWKTQRKSNFPDIVIVTYITFVKHGRIKLPVKFQEDSGPILRDRRLRTSNKQRNVKKFVIFETGCYGQNTWKMRRFVYIKWTTDNSYRCITKL